MKAHADGIDVLRRGDADPRCVLASWSPRRRRKSRDRVFYSGRLKAQLVEQLSTSIGIRPGHCAIDRFGWSLPHTGRG